MTKICQYGTCRQFGKLYLVVDTPGLFDTRVSHDVIKNEIRKCADIASPGPHAFLFVMDPRRMTQEEIDTIEVMKDIFGEKLFDYMIIIFTKRDELERHKTSIDNFLEESPENLSRLLQKCQQRYLAFANCTDRSDEDVLRLHQAILNLKGDDKEKYFSIHSIQREQTAIRNTETMPVDLLRRIVLANNELEQKKKQLEREIIESEKKKKQIERENIESEKKKKQIERENMVSEKKKKQIERENIESEKKKKQIEKENIESEKKKQQIERENIESEKKKQQIERENTKSEKKKKQIEKESRDNREKKEVLIKEKSVLDVQVQKLEQIIRIYESQFQEYREKERKTKSKTFKSCSIQ